MHPMVDAMNASLGRGKVYLSYNVSIRRLGQEDKQAAYHH